MDIIPIHLLTPIADNFHLTEPFNLFQSRAALSLLGYCYYQIQDFVNAADCYEQLAANNPEVEDYRLYYAQSLYKACLYDEAMKVSCQIDNPSYSNRVCYFLVKLKNMA